MHKVISLDQNVRAKTQNHDSRFEILNPALGPNLLFFSGGSGLRELAGRLPNFTFNSTHLITPFDSGGSSFEIRKAFDLIAIGDFRNRLMALADFKQGGENEFLIELFSYRLAVTESPAVLNAELGDIARLDHPLCQPISTHLKSWIQILLKSFLQRMPTDFDLRGASIGNLILVGAYFENQCDIESALRWIEKLCQVPGKVHSVANCPCHLAAELNNGEMLIGQHRIAKENDYLKNPLRKLTLSRSLDVFDPIDVSLTSTARQAILQADVICYSFGSFYSSLLASLLAKGTSSAIGFNHCPKVYIPNFKNDPEQAGLTIAEEVKSIRSVLNDSSSPTEKVLNMVLLDENEENYDRPVEVSTLQKMGLQILRADLFTEKKINCDAIIRQLLLLQ